LRAALFGMSKLTVRVSPDANVMVSSPVVTRFPVLSSYAMLPNPDGVPFRNPL
jgi:hypothetical protein